MQFAYFEKRLAYNSPITLRNILALARGLAPKTCGLTCNNFKYDANICTEYCTKIVLMQSCGE